MERKYTTDNPFPKAENNRQRKNTQRRLTTRKSAQIQAETYAQFAQILFETIKLKVNGLTRAQLAELRAIVKEQVAGFVRSEMNEAAGGAQN